MSISISANVHRWNAARADKAGERTLWIEVGEQETPFEPMSSSITIFLHNEAQLDALELAVARARALMAGGEVTMANFIQVQGARSTRFDAMPQGSLNGWILWAQLHDWCAGPDFPAWYDDMAGEMVTYCWVSAGQGGGYVEEARHSTPAELKAWAGY